MRRTLLLVFPLVGCFQLPTGSEAPPTPRPAIAPLADLLPSSGPTGNVVPVGAEVVGGWGDWLDERARRNVVPQLPDRQRLFTHLSSGPGPVSDDGVFEGVLLCDLRVAKRGLGLGRPDLRARFKVDGVTHVADGEDNALAAVISVPLRLAKGDAVEVFVEDRDLFRNDALDDVVTTFPGALPWLLAGRKETLRGTCLGLGADAVEGRLAPAREQLAAGLPRFEEACVPDRAARGWGYPATLAFDHTEVLDAAAALVGWKSELTAPAVAAFRDARRRCRDALKADVAAAKDDAAPVGAALRAGGSLVRARRSLCGPAVAAAYDGDEAGLARPCVLEVEVTLPDARALPSGFPEGATLDLVFGDGRTQTLSPYAVLDGDGRAGPVDATLQPRAPTIAWFTPGFGDGEDPFRDAVLVRFSGADDAAIGRFR